MVNSITQAGDVPARVQGCLALVVQGCNQNWRMKFGRLVMYPFRLTPKALAIAGLQGLLFL